MILKDVISHVRDRNYLSEIDRDNVRVKATGEVFTPLSVITKKLNDLETYDPTIFKDSAKTFLEPSCGDGNFLSEVLIRKLENGIDFETALRTIYGVDLMSDNVDLCRERLLCGREDLRHIVEQNIVCADALRYHYRFDGSHPYDDETKAKEEEDRFNSLFSFE
jgi:type I restriction-modification system DNA methylase subunit